MYFIDVIEPRAKRQKKDKTKKSAAFDKLKQLKGSKHKYEVDQIDNVYEVIDEREYTKQVLHRQDDDWIVDDGLHRLPILFYIFYTAYLF